MPNYQYSYLVGALIFACAWAAFYVFARTHRAQMIWGTLLAIPFAFTGFLFIPEYWSPPSLFNWAERYGISIEDVLWSAAVGGIASAVSEISFHDRLESMRMRSQERRYGPLVLVVAVFLGFEIVRPSMSIYNMMIAFAAGAAMILFVRSDLTGRMFRGAAVFAFVYLLLFAYFVLLYPDFIRRFYAVDRLWGLYVLGVPLEEVLFAFSGGAVWTVLYEYVHAYRLVSAMPPRFVRQGV